VTERLRQELEEASHALKEHMASWAYAFANGGGPNSGRDHPIHAATRERTAQLESRVRDLKARLAEHEL
jgi:hypothetical protein